MDFRFLACAAVIGLGSALAMPATAGEVHEVEMLNSGADGPFVFEPNVLFIEPGDTVRWVPTNPSHNTASIEGMLPDGAEPWQSDINDPYERTFEVEGVFGFKCEPHYRAGQVGLIVVGDNPDNLDAARAVEHPGQAGNRMAAYFDRVDDRLD